MSRKGKLVQFVGIQYIFQPILWEFVPSPGIQNISAKFVGIGPVCGTNPTCESNINVHSFNRVYPSGKHARVMHTPLYPTFI